MAVAHLLAEETRDPLREAPEARRRALGEQRERTASHGDFAARHLHASIAREPEGPAHCAHVDVSRDGEAHLASRMKHADDVMTVRVSDREHLVALGGLVRERQGQAGRHDLARAQPQAHRIRADLHDGRGTQREGWRVAVADVECCIPVHRGLSWRRLRGVWKWHHPPVASRAGG